MLMNSRNCLLAIVLGLAFAVPALAQDWKKIAQEKGVQLTYTASGNLAHLRFTNTNKEPMTVNWTTSVQLATGTRIDNKNELNLDAGETVVIAGGPYRDGGGPAEIKNVTGTLSAKKTGP